MNDVSEDRPDNEPDEADPGVPEMDSVGESDPGSPGMDYVPFSEQEGTADVTEIELEDDE